MKLYKGEEKSNEIHTEIKLVNEIHGRFPSRNLITRSNICIDTEYSRKDENGECLSLYI